MAKKVMIYAYTNFNLGDDLFLKVLCERYPKTQFYLYAPKNYKKLFKGVKNIRIFPNDTFIVRGINRIFRLMKADSHFIRTRVAKSCDAVIYIGGSLFMQDESWEKEFERKRNMYMKNKPFYLLGANFGPYQNNEYYLAHKEMFSMYTDICFRDNYSYELFKELPNVRMADDIIFQLKSKPNIAKMDKSNVAISVIKPSIRKHLIDYDEIYYKKIKDIIIYLNENGCKVTLISFCENEGDKEAIKKILNLLPVKNMKMVREHYYKYNLEETIQTIANSSFVIATRFHSMILGWVFKKPVFPIAYSEKMTNVMKDVGFNGLYTDFDCIDQLDPAEVYKSMKTNVIDVSKQIEKSGNHFKQLDDLLLN